MASLDPADERAFDISVAGVAALTVAKLHKIAERRDSADRLRDKDGLDVLRLLRFAETEMVAATLTRLEKDPVAGDVTRQAHALLGDFFADRTAVGAQMAVRASAGLEEELTIAISCEVLARQILAA
ncbi:MAG: hypothetical protein VCC00_06785 [Deltaproteobacteria bacterium]